MPVYDYIILCVAWLLWVSAFLFRKRERAGKRTPGGTLDKRARWGILLEGIAFTVVWQGRFWERDPGWRLIPAIPFLLGAIVLAWTGVRSLGRQWRLDAGLNADHQLVRSGPYRRVRHPIYASMFCLLLGDCFVLTPWPLFLVAVLIFIAGTEIRVRVEEKLLAARFGAELAAYQNSVPAYIPFVR